MKKYWFIAIFVFLTAVKQLSKNSFTSDNTSMACPEVMDAVIAANSGIAMSYGDDYYSNRLQAQCTQNTEHNENMTKT